MDINQNTVLFRSLMPEDVEKIVGYWLGSPPSFIESMGIDPTKLPDAAKMRSSLLLKAATNLEKGDQFATQLIILYHGQAVGLHGLSHIEEGCGVFHAHIWDSKHRGQGLGTYTYPRACRIFLDRFQLQKIRFESPCMNPAIHAIKSKLNLSPISEAVMDQSQMIEGTTAKVYEINRNDLDRLYAAARD